jgi:Tfp pilus assembly protein PilV
MKWLVTILAILVGVLLIATIKLASITHVDSSAEALRAMAELREALQHCEAAKRQADSDPPTPVRAPAREPTFEDRLPTETAKQKCMREAERLGRVAALWCAGL